MIKSRKEKILRLFMQLKESERNHDSKTISKIISKFRLLNLTSSEIENLDLSEYFMKKNT